MAGTVNWFDVKKGWGFIHGIKESANEDIFLHHSQAVNPTKEFVSYKENERLTFTLKLGKKGWSAEKVEKVA